LIMQDVAFPLARLKIRHDAVTGLMGELDDGAVDTALALDAYFLFDAARLGFWWCPFSIAASVIDPCVHSALGKTVRRRPWVDSAAAVGGRWGGLTVWWCVVLSGDV